MIRLPTCVNTEAKHSKQLKIFDFNKVHEKLFTVDKCGCHNIYVATGLLTMKNMWTMKFSHVPRPPILAT